MNFTKIVSLIAIFVSAVYASAVYASDSDSVKKPTEKLELTVFDLLKSYNECKSNTDETSFLNCFKNGIDDDNLAQAVFAKMNELNVADEKDQIKILDELLKAQKGGNFKNVVIIGGVLAVVAAVAGGVAYVFMKKPEEADL